MFNKQQILQQSKLTDKISKEANIIESVLNSSPHMPILGSFNSAANKYIMSKIWTNGVQLSDWVENTVRKEEIARNEQFLLFPQCFQKLSVVDALKSVFME